MNIQDNQEFSSSRPTTDLILDFDGGTVRSGEGYALPLETGDAFSGFEFTGFTPFPTSDNSPGNANEQIFQILAGVREDFADFNVNVIWDDRGVDSPFFDNQDTVFQITGNTITDILPDVPAFVLLGITNVDVPEWTGNSSIQSQQDIAVIFSGLLELFNLPGFIKTYELINNISHEAGHSFGLSHVSEPDSENLQIVSFLPLGEFVLDTRFSPEPLNHDDPEVGVVYSEVERLNEAVGPASVLPGDTQSSQTLPNNPTTSVLGTLGDSDILTGSGRVDFLGDRDAFRFEIQEAGEYTIIQSTNESSLTPVVTLWDAEGDFVSVGNVGTDGVSEITFNADAGTYYAIGGSEADRQPSGMLPDPQIGAYDVFVVDGAFKNNQIGSLLDDVLTGDGEKNFLAGKGGNDLLRGNRDNDLLLGEAGDDRLVGQGGDDTLKGGDGNDRLWGEAGDDLLDGGAGNDRLWGWRGEDTLDGGSGEDTLEGGDGDDLLKGNRDNDLLLGEAGDDRLVGQGGDDTLLGGQGDDRLWGEAGDDSLDGGAGDDFILGWKGNDTIRGGSGRDTFVFAPNHGTDTIADFTVGEDSIGLKDGLSVTDLSVSIVNGDTEIALRGKALAILENQSLSAADIDFISV